MLTIKYTVLAGLAAVAFFSTPALARDNASCFTTGSRDAYIKICTDDDRHREHAWRDNDTRHDKDWGRDRDRHDHRHGDHDRNRHKQPRVVKYYYPVPAHPGRGYGHSRHSYGPYYYNPYHAYYFNGVRIR